MRYKTIAVYYSWPGTDVYIVKRSLSLKTAIAKAEEVVKHGFLKGEYSLYGSERIFEVRIYKRGNLVDIVKGARTP